MTIIIASEKPAKTPVHLWLVAILALLWNSVGAYDYVATQLQLPGYMSQFTVEQLEYFNAIPVWAVAAWAIAVWFAVLASLGLLLRRRRAFQLFVISLLAMIISMVNSFLLSNGLEIIGAGGAIFSGVIFVIGVLLVWYSKAMVRRGALR